MIPPSVKPYQPRKRSRTRAIDVRGLRYNLREWGEPDAPLLVMLHGHQDASITWQFVVDCFSRDWRIVAPDWRGFGESGWAPLGYWFLDYLADLDCVLEQVSPDAPVRVVGHSLGGNTVNNYAGVRPERVARMITVDGFGLRNRKADEAPAQFGRFLKGWREPVKPQRPYASLPEMADRLVKANARLDPSFALFLAEHLSRRRDDGAYVWRFDPGHARPFGTLHRIDEWAACWRRIACPSLWIASAEDFPPTIRDDDFSLDWRIAQAPNARFVRVPETGHNVQHDAPAELARLIEDFMLEP